MTDQVQRERFIRETAEKLLEQGRYAMDDDMNCVYRTVDGCGCAIGVHIPWSMDVRPFETHRITHEKCQPIVDLIVAKYDLNKFTATGFLGTCQAKLHDMRARKNPHMLTPDEAIAEMEIERAW